MNNSLVSSRALSLSHQCDRRGCDGLPDWRGGSAPSPGGRTQLVCGIFRGLELRAICPRTSKQLFRF